MVEGTVEAIVKAYKNRQAGTLQPYVQGAITNAQFNRSLEATIRTRNGAETL